jgi:hypothetical protein
VEGGEYFDSTVGLKCEKGGKASIIRVEYFRLADGSVALQPVSGRTLVPTGAPVAVSRTDFNARPQDIFNFVIEARWAMEKCGYELCSPMDSPLNAFVGCPQ